MKILVTGGAGFIGSHVCERLIKDGHEVVCVDSFITGSRKNIAHLEKGKGFTLLEHDITEPLPGDWSDLDRVYHLACPASPADYRQIPLQTLMTSALGTKNVLDIVGKYFLSFVLASSSEVYGDPLQHPQKEEYRGNVNTVGERSCYTEGKRFAETLSWNYWKHFQFDLKIVRIFNTYGPRMRKHDGRCIPEFISRALAGEPLPVHGDGLQTRSFCYIDDMVDGLVAIPETDKKFLGPVNLGNPEEITINNLAKKIVSLTKSESTISHVDKAPDDPVMRRPDVSLAKEKTGFQPKVGLEDGLLKTIEYFRQN